MRPAPRIGSFLVPSPYTVEVNAPILEARRLMLTHRIHHLPVTRAGRLVGVVSDRDIKLVLGPEFDYPDPRELTVEDVFVDRFYQADPDTPLAAVLRTMADSHIGAALIAEDDALLGIFTTTDACRVFAEWLTEADAAADADDV